MKISRIRERDGFEVSRAMYIIEALFEYLIYLLTSGAFLAKLTTTIGISDGMTAILSAITSLSGIFQIVSIYLAHRKPVKRWIIPMQILTHCMLASLYLIPFVGFKSNPAMIFFVIIVTAKALQSIASPIKVDWFISLVAPKKRGSYTAVLQIVSVVGSTIFTLVASSIVDGFERCNDMNGAFATITIMIAILVVLTNLPLFFSKEKPLETEKRPSPFASLSSLLHNKRYRFSVVAITLYAVATGITIPFIGTYQIKELGFSMTFIAAIEAIVAFLRVGVLVLFGKMSKKRSHPWFLGLDFIVSIGLFASIMLANPATGMVAFTVYYAANAVRHSANAISQNNLILEIVSPEEQTSALAISTIFTGVLGFLATLAVTPLVELIQKNGLTVFGLEIYAQQAFAAISLVLVIAISVMWAVYCKKYSDRASS